MRRLLTLLIAILLVAGFATSAAAADETSITAVAPHTLVVNDEYFVSPYKVAGNMSWYYTYPGVFPFSAYTAEGVTWDGKKSDDQPCQFGTVWKSNGHVLLMKCAKAEM